MSKLTDIRRYDDEFYKLADYVEDGIRQALGKRQHFDILKEYEDTIKSVAYAATEELIERVAEVEDREKQNVRDHQTNT